jgi:diguanylate cyclase (GGDEF)-like protein/PAS domain S-box-containing protein
MVADPGSGLPGGSALDRELLDLALSAHGAVSWSFDFVDDEVTWMAGMDALLGMPGAAEQETRARLLELVEPWRVAAETTAVAQDLDLEQPVVNRDGETRFLRFHARPLGGRRAGGLIGLVRDVTGLHRDRQALTDLADRYRLIVELSPEAICVHHDEVIKYANPAMSTIVGAESNTQLLGRPLADFVAPDSIPRMRERIRALASPGAVTPRAEAELRRLDGSTVPVELVAVNTTWEGHPAVQVIGRDVTAQKAAEATLRYQAALVEHVNNAIIATDRGGVVTSWNPAAEAVYGVPAGQALGRHVTDLVGAPVRPEALIASGGDTEASHRRRDGASLIVRISAAEMESGFVLVCADETARRRAEQNFATVVAALDEGVIVVGPSGIIESANPAAQRILGAREAEILGSSPTSWLLSDESGAALRPEEHPSMLAQTTGEPENSRVVRLRRPDGSSVWLAATSRSLTPQEGPPHMVVTSFSDITESRAARERLEYEATHDPLTGLANRTLVLRHLGWPEQSSQRTHEIAVLFVDLDNFKLINDSLGHGVGDEVLRIVGERLIRATSDEDLVGRLGGDEFVILTGNEIDCDTLGELSERLLNALGKPIHLQGRQLHVTGSIGVLVSRPGDTRDGQDLLRDADVAMYRAKTQGGGRYAFFDVELRERVQRHMALEQDLRYAVQQDELSVAYQPVVDLHTGRTVAAEGLLRWTHPLHGTVSPGEFIPVAEESDLINPIGEHMLRTATRQVAAERARHELDLQLNANVSPRQLEDPHLQSIVQQALAEAELPASALCLEITENAIMQDPTAAARVLNSLRELGVSLAIDDFGTGYSSLAQLRRLPLHTLKVDRSFITDLGESNELQVIVTSIVAMAHAVGLNVVAEGVETAEQLDFLHHIGCDHAQGYYLGKPAPIGQLLTMRHSPRTPG